MAHNHQLSQGAAQALAALPQGPRDIEVTMQIKGSICGWRYHALSDGVYWVPAIFTDNFRRKCRWTLESKRVVTITKVYFFKSWGYVSSYCGLRYVDAL